MSDLREQLERLAEEAPRRLPASDLWARGRRQHRTRQAGTAALLVALVVVLGLVLGLGRLSQHQPEPTAPRGSTTIPNRIYSPSGWLPTTDQKGPLGQLIAITSVYRNHLDGRRTVGIVGISTTGVYRFIDLPGWLPGPDVAGEDSDSGIMDAEYGAGVDTGDVVKLSPDGRYIAYFAGGATSAQPYGRHPIASVAVYDTSTGQVVRARVPTRHGLSPQSLLWAADGRLVINADQLVKEGTPPGQPVLYGGRYGTAYVWRPASGARSVSTLATGIDWGVNSLAQGGRLGVSLGGAHQRRGRLISIAQRRTAGRFTLSRTTGGQLVFSPGMRSVVTIWPGGDGELEVGSLGGGHLYRLTPLSDHHYDLLSILRWNGSNHVDAIALTGYAHQGAGGHSFNGFRDVVRSVNVSTGAERTLIEQQSNMNRVEYATSLLAHRTVSTPAPPHPWNPREEYGWLTAWVLACLAGLVVWRRRARP